MVSCVTLSQFKHDFRTWDMSQVLKSRLRCGYEELLDTSALVGTFVADNRSLQTSFLHPSRPSLAVQNHGLSHANHSCRQRLAAASALR